MFVSTKRPLIAGRTRCKVLLDHVPNSQAHPPGCALSWSAAMQGSQREGLHYSSSTQSIRARGGTLKMKNPAWMPGQTESVNSGR
jgi:hypothetical protein